MCKKTNQIVEFNLKKITKYQKKRINFKSSYYVVLVALVIGSQLASFGQNSSLAYSIGAKVIPNDQAYSAGTLTNTTNNTTNITLNAQNAQLESGDSAASWNSSDAGFAISQETTVKQEGSGSVKAVSQAASGIGNIGTWSTTNQTQLPTGKTLHQSITKNIGGTNYIWNFGGSNTPSVVQRASLDASGDITSSWSNSGQSQLPADRQSHCVVTADIGGTTYLYLIGGYNPTTLTPSNAVYRSTIDGSGNVTAWSTSGQGQLSGPAYDTSCIIVNVGGTNYAYLLGQNNGSANSSVQRATIDSSGNIGAWSNSGQTSMNFAIQGHTSVTTTVNGIQYIYVLGGFNGSATKNMRGTLDTSGNVTSWANLTAFASNYRTGTTIVATAGGAQYLYYIGGTTGSNQTTVQKTTINSTTGNIGSWDTTDQGQLPAARASHTTVMITISSNTYLYTIGGGGATTTVYKSTLSTTAATYTATRTLSPVDLSDIQQLKFYVYSSRTGTYLNFHIGENSASEFTSSFAIDSANTWEQKTVDISAMSNIAKNAITILQFEVSDNSSLFTMYFDDIRTAGYNPSGTYESAAIDAAGSGQIADFTTLSSTTTIPAGTTLTIETASSSDGSTFGAYQALSGSNIQSSNNRYIKVKVSFTSTGTNTSTLTNFTVNYNYSAAPTISVVSVDQLSRSEDSTNTGKVKIIYNSSDSDDAAVTISLEYFNQASETYSTASSTSGDIGSSTPGSNKTIYWTASTDISGIYWNSTKIRLTISDGVNSVTSESLVYTLDTQAPTGATASTPSNSAINQDLSLTLTSASASDNTTSGLQYNIEYASNNTITTDVVSSGFQTENTFDISGLDLATTYYWRIKARDAFNNTLTSSVFSFTTASGAPDITNLSASQGTNGKVTITYDTTDANSSALTATIRWYNGSSFVLATIESGDSGTITTGPGKSAIWDVATDFPIDATSDMRVKVTVTDGTNTDSAISDTFDVDTRAPICTGLTINDGVRKINSLDVTIKLYCDNTAVEMITSNDSDYSSDGQNSNSGVWRTYQTPFSWKLASGPDGIRNVYIKVRNYSLGETVLATITSSTNTTDPEPEVDLTSPSADISYFYQQRACSETFADLFWDKAKPKPSDFAGYKIERKKVNESYSTIAEVTNYDTITFRNNNLTAQENYYFRVSAYDQAGNTSSPKEISSLCTFTPTETPTPTTTPTPIVKTTPQPTITSQPQTTPTPTTTIPTPTPASQYTWTIFGTPICYPYSNPIGGVTHLRITAPSPWYITSTASADAPYASGSAGFSVLLAGIDPFGSSGIISLYSGTYPNGQIKGLVVFTHLTEEACAEPTPANTPPPLPSQEPDNNPETPDNVQDEGIPEDIIDDLEWQISGVTKCFPNYPSTTGGITVFSVAALTNWYVLASSSSSSPFAAGSEGLFNNIALGVDPFGSSGTITLYSGFYPNGVQKAAFFFTTPGSLENCATSQNPSPTPAKIAPTGKANKPTQKEENDPNFSFTRKRQKIDPASGQIFVDRTPPPTPNVTAELIFNPTIITDGIGNILRQFNPFNGQQNNPQSPINTP